MTLYDLPDSFVSEASQYNTLLLKGTTRTTTGNTSFTSASNGTVYNSTTGELGIMQQLATALSPYIVNANVINNKRDVNAGTTTGSANTYAVTVSPAPTAYTDFLSIIVKINADNTGASTINVNSLGAKTIVDSKGNALVTGKLKAGSIYTMIYNLTTGNFILQGEGGDILNGTLTPDKALAGYTFYNTNSSQLQIGTLINNTSAGIVITPSTSDQAVTQGYTDGNLNSIKVKGDPNLVSSNIPTGITMFGINGSFSGKQVASGSQSYSYAVGTSSKTITINTGVNFTPTKLFINPGYIGDTNNGYISGSMLGYSTGDSINASIYGKGGSFSTPRVSASFDRTTKILTVTISQGDYSLEANNGSVSWYLEE